MGRYNDLILFTHNETDGPGYFGIADTTTQKFRTTSAQTPTGFHHPSGFQVIGDYAAVGIDKNESSSYPSYVYIYDLSPLKNGENPYPLAWSHVEQSEWGAAAVGITAVDGAYMAVYSSHHGTVLIYQSTPASSATPT